MPDNFVLFLSTFPQKIEALHAQRPSASSLGMQALRAYYDRVLARLSAFKQPSKEDLQFFLKENWELIRGSHLAYTALPLDGISLLCCEMAEALADGEVGALNWLMPGVNSCSLDEEKYPHLGAYREYSFDEHLNLLTQDKMAAVNLKTIIKTHILGLSGRYLIPVHYLLAQLEPGKPVLNYYFDDFAHEPENWCLNETELLRLFAHSPLTQELEQNFKAYYAQADSQPSFLKQLRSLQRSFYLAGAHGGAGSPEDAALMVFPKIIEFMSYYQQLKPAIVRQIPEDLRAELAYFTSLCSEPSKNAPNGQTHLDTCLGTRSEVLEELITRHELLLAQIATECPSAEDLLKYHESLVLTKQKLAAQLAEFTYCGVDYRGLNARLLRELAVPVKLNSYQNVLDLMSLHEEELRSLLNEQDSAVKEQVLAQLSSLESTLNFFCDLRSEPKFRVVFSALFSELCKREVFDLVSVLYLLELLSPALKTIVSEGLIEELKQRIGSSTKELGVVLACLNPEQIKALCDLLKLYLPDFFASITSFATILKELDYQQAQAFCLSLKLELAKLLTSVDEFCCLANKVQEEQMAAVYLVMKVHLLPCLDSVGALNSLLLALNGLHVSFVFQGQQESLPRLVGSINEYKQLLQGLNRNQVTAVYHLMKGKFPSLVHSLEDFLALAPLLHGSELRILCSLLVDKLRVWIQPATVDFIAEEMSATLNASQMLALYNGLSFLDSDLRGRMMKEPDSPPPVLEFGFFHPASAVVTVTTIINWDDFSNCSFSDDEEDRMNPSSPYSI